MAWGGVLISTPVADEQDPATARAALRLMERGTGAPVGGGRDGSRNESWSEKTITEPCPGYAGTLGDNRPEMRRPVLLVTSA